MLYFYKDKVYVKPFENKIIEVEVKKDGNEYDVQATQRSVEINRNDLSELYSITIEEAYKIQNKNGNSKENKKDILL